MTKNHTFDSRQTVITVGPNKMRFPFDTEEQIFSMFDINPNCLKARGEKLKRDSITQESCGVCRQAWTEKKMKKIV